ncbi:MAG: C10 family peptidase [Proteobacteria bacterium]|nr:C10 family peptidase [Pseudomonadota bacterium]
MTRHFTACFAALALAASTVPTAFAGVDPMLQTEWGQGDEWKQSTPIKSGDSTYPGCTTLASAQVLYYYRYQTHGSSEVSYVLEHDGLSGADVADGVLTRDIRETAHAWDAMALTLDESPARVTASAAFIYDVGVSLNAQFGGGEGSSATGRQIENAMRYQWGFNHKARREMTIISKDAFQYSDAEWQALMHAELDAGRPVLYMAQQVDANAGHAFVIDGYRDVDGKVHVNWGWGGYANGWYDANSLTDPSGRSWSRQAMIYLGLEPEPGFAAALRGESAAPAYTWHGNGSIIGAASGTATGYGLTLDEAMLHSDSAADPVVFFQWEVDPSDGDRLRIDAEQASTATLTYGPWNDRTADRTYHDVTLPFVLDPKIDGFDPASQPYYVMAVRFDQAPAQTGIVSATATTDSAATASSSPAQAFTVDGKVWTGTGSVIANASGSATGYGLTQDEAIRGAGAPAMVVFQWEIDTSDGTTLRLDSEGPKSATLRYGSWASRADDVVKTITLPYVLDPAADGLSAADGEYYTLQIAFDEGVSSDAIVTAQIR